ncbi:MAG: monovalent cation/H+ antiporter subunit A [Nannocystaceae bacterium]|nr:monovalent cation/H+ antiporter subunit A [bacterium]
MWLIAVIAIPLLLCWVPIWGSRIAGRNGSAWGAGIVTALSMLALSQTIDPVLEGGMATATIEWMPTLGMDLALRLDGLALLMCTLVLGIGALVVLYGRYYLDHFDRDDRFFAFLLLFMGAMLGVVTSENILGLVVFWELTSVSSFLLVAFKNDKAEARKGARRALGVTGLGGLCLLAGMLMLGDVVGSFALTDVLAAHERIIADARYPYLLGLILLGVFTKSAQFPFHFWLPGAMSAPTPASAYLHSATMVKAGVFLLVRLWPALSGTDLWFWVVTGVGLSTMVFSAFVALFQRDIKGLLAYSTISHLGLITALTGLNTTMAVVAAIFHIINHATFKASLFMAAGIIDHEAGSRDLEALGGLAKYMRSTAVLAAVAASAMAGIPLLNGFLSKEMFFKEAVEVGAVTGWVLPALATVGGIFSVAYSVRFVWGVFFGPETGKLEKTPHPPPTWMQFPVWLLVTLCVIVGVIPAVVIEPSLVGISHSVLGDATPHIEIHLWHGVNLPLVMSLIAVAVGVTLFLKYDAVAALRSRFPTLPRGVKLYNASLGVLYRLARGVTEVCYTDSLTRYTVLVLVSGLVLCLSPFVSGGMPTWSFEALTAEQLPVVAFVLLLALGAVATVKLRHRRLFALIVLGLSGLGTTLLFVELSAPDLALTQLSVELATTVLILLALFFLPEESEKEGSGARHGRDWMIAGAVGLGVAVLLFAVLDRPASSIADYYIAQSKPEGGGTNIVNVILVDFRGFDTMGEVTVLAIAAVAIAALLENVRMVRRKTTLGATQRAKQPYPFMLATMTRPLLPLLLLVAVFIMLRGHNLPGGGFIAGLVTSVALVLQFLASGLRWTFERLRIDYTVASALGLIIVVATGATAMLFGQPFLTTAFTHVHLGPIDFELASAMAFDLGVFITVVAVLLIITVRLGEVGEEEGGGES